MELILRPNAGQAALHRIHAIAVDERHRCDLGDIPSLAANMADLGQLQAIGVTPDGTLIWGKRRPRAAKLLGWTDLEAKIFPIDSSACGEYVENNFRKDFTLSAVAIKRRLEPIDREAAKERQREAPTLSRRKPLCAICNHNTETYGGRRGRCADGPHRPRPTLVGRSRPSRRPRANISSALAGRPPEAAEREGEHVW